MDFEQLYDHCYRADNLKSGDRLPVGGSLGSDKMSLFLKLDSEEFFDFFHISIKNAEKFPRTELKKWMNTAGAAEFDVDMFAKLYAFSAVFQKMYPEASINFAERKKHFSPEKPLKLSDSLANGIAACAEIAALGQIYLQKSGIESRYFSGELMTERNNEFAEEHSFVIFAHQGKNYVFDPARPIKSGGVEFPNIAEVKLSSEEFRQFETRIHPPKDADPNARYSAFMETENILTHAKTYYGVNDRMNVSEGHIYPQKKQDVSINLRGGSSR